MDVWLDGHWLACGPNEVGKTTLVRRLMREVERVAILDTKLSGDFDDWLGIRHTVQPLVVSADKGRIVYHAPPGANWQDDAINDFFAACWMRGNVTVVVDEAVHACTAGGIPPMYRGCLRSGRGRGIQVVTLAQRLVGLHNDALSESWTYVLFSPITGTDPAKAREFGVGEGALAWLADDRRRLHDFLVWDRRLHRVAYEYEAARAERRGSENGYIRPAQEGPAGAEASAEAGAC